MKQVVQAKLQRYWDLRAAGNFSFGGTGSGLIVAAALALAIGTPDSFAVIVAVVLGLGLIGLGLFCVWLEIGRPWRAINVFFHPHTSWMTREALLVPPLMASAAAAVLFDIRFVFLAALFAAGAVYLLVGLASSIALPPSELQESTGPLLAVVEATGVSIPSWLFSLIALIAVANGALLTMIMVSRLTYGMAEQTLLPSLLARVLPKRKTPWMAILVTTLVAMGLTLVGDLATLAETVVLLLLFVFLSANVSVLILRRDRVEHDHFRVWTFVPVLGIASCVLLLTQQRPIVWLFGGLLLAVGVILHFVARWGRRRSARR